jgi:hypothetical protein
VTGPILGFKSKYISGLPLQHRCKQALKKNSSSEYNSIIHLTVKAFQILIQNSGHATQYLHDDKIMEISRHNKTDTL